MNGIDTNVLVRFLVKDDSRQAARARRIMETGPVWIPKTVLLETEWVLRYTYGFDRAAVNHALAKVCGLSQVLVEDAPVVTQALAWHQAGFDFADALHLACSAAAQVFYSFDRALARQAKAHSGVTVSEP